MEQSIPVQSLLFSQVIKQRIDLLAGDSYLSPPPVLCLVPLSGPQGLSVWKLKRLLSFSTAVVTQRVKLVVSALIWTTRRFVCLFVFAQDWRPVQCVQIVKSVK